MLIGNELRIAKNILRYINKAFTVAMLHSSTFIKNVSSQSTTSSETTIILYAKYNVPFYLWLVTHNNVPLKSYNMTTLLNLNCLAPY